MVALVVTKIEMNMMNNWVRGWLIINWIKGCWSILKSCAKHFEQAIVKAGQAAERYDKQYELKDCPYRPVKCLKHATCNDCPISEGETDES